MCTQGSADFIKMLNSRIWSTQETMNGSEGGKWWGSRSDLCFTFRSRLPVPALVFGLLFWKPVAVDHWAGFCLENSSGRTGTSPRGRTAREGSLLRRTWRGISVWKDRGRQRKGKRRLEGTVSTTTAMLNLTHARHFLHQCSTGSTFLEHNISADTRAVGISSFHSFMFNQSVKDHMASLNILWESCRLIGELCCEVIWTFPKDHMDLFLNSISLSYIHNYANCRATTCQGLVHRCSEHMLALSFHLIQRRTVFMAV